MDNFYNTAIMLVYPDGYTEKIMINKEVSHKKNYEDLAKKSERFNSFIKSKNIIIDELVHSLNIELVNSNIVVINNIDIYDIVYDKNFLKMNMPRLIFNFPPELTSEQKEVLKSIFDEYGLDNSIFGKIINTSFQSITYYEVLDYLHEMRK